MSSGTAIAGVEALTFLLRRLSAAPVIAVLIYRGPSDRLDEAAQRMAMCGAGVCMADSGNVTGCGITGAG